MSGSTLAVPRPHVLVVDPDADTRGLYEQSFTMAGFTVTQATDGRDALTKALVHPPMLVLMELRLPLIDGVALCEILRRDRATTRIPILVVTGEARSAELERVRALGATDVLLKPVAVDLLAQRASQLMAASHDSPRTMRSAPERGPMDFAGHGSSVIQVKRRPAVARTRRELTTTPPHTPPALSCPSCDRPLIYNVSHTGGVNERHTEQWDYFTCSGCGWFRYRHRTRKLRHLDASEEQWLQRYRTYDVRVEERSNGQD